MIFSSLSKSNIITKYINMYPARNKLYDIQKDLIGSSNFTFYTNRSLIDLNKETRNMTFGFALISDSTSTALFTLSVKKWLSSLRAEMMAILTAFIITPESTIDIYTDSESSIKHFNNLKITNFHLSARNILKQQHNLHIWNNICEIITSLNLQVNLHYVKVHSGNIWNDYIDEKVKLAHNDDSTSVIILTAANLNNLKFFPR